MDIHTLQELNTFADQNTSLMAEAADTYPMKTTNGIYFGKVRHRRMVEPVNEFSYKTALFFLEISGADITWEAQRILGRWPKLLIRFRAGDYMPESPLPLEDSVRQLVLERTGTYPRGRIFLLTNIRTANWNFNPISVYYVFSDTTTSQSLDAVVMEVNNTPWNERTYYVMTTPGSRYTKHLFDKKMHVSPFLPMDLSYDVIATCPGKRLSLRFVLSKEGKKTFDADLWLKFAELNHANIAKIFSKGYLTPIKTSLAIYRQAVSLKLRGAKWYRHPNKLRQDKNGEA
ncbi:MAG: DUF1365 domain-containing protein [Firmicutes bacterium]|nr:DUF1365 domain-containing protein [Bacillota bacterium]